MDTTGNNVHMARTHAFRELVRRPLRHPADAIGLIVLLTIAGLSVLDLLGLLEIPNEALVSIAVFFVSLYISSEILLENRRRQSETVLNRVDSQIRALVDSYRSRTSIEEVPSDQIRTRIKEMTAESTFWYFQGGSGRWQRSWTLPTLSANRKSDMEFVMQILDPQDQELCARYARYRALQRSTAVLREDEERPEVVREDLLACIYAAGWYGARSRVRPKVYLRRLYSPARIDLGSDGVILSVASPEASAIFSPNGSWYYHAVLDELREATQELTEVVLPSEGENMFPQEWSNVREDHVVAFFNRVMVRQPGNAPVAFAHSAWGTVDHARIASLAFEGRES
jgi:hypothetical protein